VLPAGRWTREAAGRSAFVQEKCPPGASRVGVKGRPSRGGGLQNHLRGGAGLFDDQQATSRPLLLKSRQPPVLAQPRLGGQAPHRTIPVRGRFVAAAATGRAL
jgi:hypothetical protein